MKEKPFKTKKNEEKGIFSVLLHRTHPGYSGAPTTCALWDPPLPAGSAHAGTPCSGLGIFPGLRSSGAAPAPPGKCCRFGNKR